MNKPKNRVLVTGGNGFLAGTLIKQLLQNGYGVSTIVRSEIKNNFRPEVNVIIGDIVDKSLVEKMMTGIDTVFHVAAKVGHWGKKEEYFHSNVLGTRTLIDAAIKQRVSKFILTSTPSVVGYDNEIVNGEQAIPYARKYNNFYSRTKAIAERMTLRVDQNVMQTIALRPHLVFGEEDNNLLPKLIESASRKRLPRIGRKDVMVDFTYVENAAHAHVQSMKALINKPEVCRGKAYFISNQEPVYFWSWFNSMLNDLDVSPVSRSYSIKMLRPLVGFIEYLYLLLGIKSPPPMTRFVVDALSKSHWFEAKPSQKDLDYFPFVKMEEAKDLTVQWMLGNLNLEN